MNGGRFVPADRDLWPFARDVDPLSMRWVIELLLWSVAAIVGLSGAAFLGAKLIPPYLIHE